MSVTHHKTTSVRLPVNQLMLHHGHLRWQFWPEFTRSFMVEKMLRVLYLHLTEENFVPKAKCFLRSLLVCYCKMFYSLVYFFSLWTACNSGTVEENITWPPLLFAFRVVCPNDTDALCTLQIPQHATIPTTASCETVRYLAVSDYLPVISFVEYSAW